MVKEIIEEAMKRDGRIVPLGYHLPVNGGCLFCHHADLPMELKSSSKLRANFHLECLKAKLKAFPDDREVQLLTKEFKNELEDVRAAQLAFIVEEVMLEDRKPVAIFTTSKDEAENWAKQYEKTRSGFPWESFCSIRECYLNPENIDMRKYHYVWLDSIGRVVEQGSFVSDMDGVDPRRVAACKGYDVNCALLRLPSEMSSHTKAWAYAASDQGIDDTIRIAKQKLQEWKNLYRGTNEKETEMEIGHRSE